MVHEIIDTKTLFTIVHLFGVAVGAGGAYASDLMFFKSTKDDRITKSEFGFLVLGSTMVWAGLFILIVSGFVLFLQNPEGYLSSSKFLSKMTIIGIIIINGVIFHLSHIPRLSRHAGTHFPSSDEFMRKRTLLLASGVISFVSWTAALVLGAWSGIPYSYSTIMLAYILITAFGIGISITFKEAFIHGRKR